MSEQSGANHNDPLELGSPAQSVEFLEAEIVLRAMADLASMAGITESANSAGGLAGSSKTLRAEAISDQSDLVKANLRYRSLVEHIPVVTFMADLGGAMHELYVSPQIEALLGFTQEEWLANPFLWYNQLHPDDRERWQSAFGQTCMTGVNFRSDYRFIARDGRVVWVHGECQVIRDEKGQPLFLQGIAYDITDAKRAEEALQRISHDLEVKVQERTAALERVNQALRAEIEQRERLESALEERARQLLEEGKRKDHFLAILGHELRNPLSPIGLALELLSAADSTGQDRQWALQVAGRQVKLMNRLIDDLLDVSRIGLGKIELRRERINLHAVIERAIQTTRPFMCERKHALHAEIGGEGIWLDADAVRIEQVVVNLLTNAAKYTEPGGQIWIRVRTEGGIAELSVRDTGMGIPAEMLDRIFELFTQVDPSIARKSQWGLGIGLALVRGLVELHGGTIEAKSEGTGKGSEFVVRLPWVKEAENQAAPVRTNAAKAAAPTLQFDVLIVEDQLDSADALSRILKRWGHSVRMTHDGLSAIEMCRQRRPDVVLLDIGLPGMDGYDVARVMRGLPGFDGTRLFALTGYGREEDLERAREAGFDRHLIKPIDPTTLQRVLGEGAEETMNDER